VAQFTAGKVSASETVTTQPEPASVTRRDELSTRRRLSIRQKTRPVFAKLWSAVSWRRIRSPSRNPPLERIKSCSQTIGMVERNTHVIQNPSTAAQLDSAQTASNGRFLMGWFRKAGRGRHQEHPHGHQRGGLLGFANDIFRRFSTQLSASCTRNPTPDTSSSALPRNAPWQSLYAISISSISCR